MKSSQKIGDSPLLPFNHQKHITPPGNTAYIGLDIGEKSSPAAVVICQLIKTPDPDLSELHVIFLKQYALKTKMRVVVEEIDQLSINRSFGGVCPIIILDASGSGGVQATELLKEKDIVPLIPITIISAGTGKSHLNVRKEYLIENLVEFISDGRLKISKGLKESPILFKELEDYRGQPSPKGRTITYRSIGADGTDDFIDCLSLVAWGVLKRWKPRYVLDKVGLYGQGLLTRRPSSGRACLY